MSGAWKSPRRRTGTSKARGLKRKFLRKPGKSPEQQKADTRRCLHPAQKASHINGKRAAALSNSALLHQQRSHHCAAAEETHRLPDLRMVQVWHCCSNPAPGKPRSQPDNKPESGKSQRRPALPHSQPNGRAQGLQEAGLQEAGLQEAGGWPRARCCSTDTSCAASAHYGNGSGFCGIWGQLHITAGLPSRLFV